MLGRSLHHGLVSSSCGSFIRKTLAVILHPLMLSGLGITATPSRVKDVITNSAALQVVRAHLIACLDFSALITGLLVWHLADDSLQPEQQGCYPEWPSWLQPREHLWDRVACMSNARGLLQFCRFCSLRSDKAGMSLGSGFLRIEAASERGSMSTVIARGLSRLRIRGSHFSCFLPNFGRPVLSIASLSFYVGWSSQSDLHHLDFPFFFSALHYSCAN